MSQLQRHHRVLNEHGEGKCSVPMWSGGAPDGFCDKPAYGEPMPGRQYRDSQGEMRRTDGRYNGYVPGLACYAHGGPTDHRSKCVVCGVAFVEGDELQAFLRCPDDPAGSWTEPGRVDAEYQARAMANKDRIKRKHKSCQPVADQGENEYD